MRHTPNDSANQASQVAADTRAVLLELLGAVRQLTYVLSRQPGAPLPSAPEPERVASATWPRWMPASVCANYLGNTPRAIESLAQRGHLPYGVLGRRKYFDREAIDRLLTKSRRRMAVGLIE